MLIVLPCPPVSRDRFHLPPLFFKDFILQRASSIFFFRSACSSFSTVSNIVLYLVYSRKSRDKFTFQNYFLAIKKSFSNLENRV
ncbi:hypothetical protein BpHYR1_054659, partial [Brachionus plicatilis]